MTPHRCTILAIDPGKVSGWAVYHGQKCISSGTARGHAGRSIALATAKVPIDRDTKPHIIIVAEKWTPGGKFAGARSMAGLGAQWGLWLAAIEEAGIPKSRIVRVFPQTWRARVLAPRRGTKSEALKLMAIRRASMEVGHDRLDDNEADAICIGVWATRAPEVAAKVPKRGKR